MARKNNVLYDLLNSYTNEWQTYTKVTTWLDGTAMSNSKCDGVIYRKKGLEYFKLNFTDGINVSWWGAVGDYNTTTGIGTDSTNAFTKAIAFACSNTTQQYIDVPPGNYLIKQDQVITSNNVIIRGTVKNRCRIYLDNGVSTGFKMSNTQVAGLDKLQIYTTVGNTTTVHGIWNDSSPVSSYRDLVVTGYYTNCAIRHGVDSWSCTYDNVQVNQISNGDGWWFREGNVNAVIIRNSTATNIATGVGVSFSQCSGTTFDNFRIEGNPMGNFEIYANTGNNAGIRGLFINNLYYEQAAGSIGQPLFTIKHLGGVMNIRDFIMIGGHARCGNKYFADLRGIIPGNGSGVFKFQDVTINDVSPAAFIWDSQIRGKIDNERPYNRSTLVEQTLIDTSMSNLGRVVVVERSSTGLEFQKQQLNLGPLNSTAPQLGSIWWDTADIKFYDGISNRSVRVKGKSYIAAADTTYTADQIMGDSLIAVNAGAIPITISVPAFATVPTNTTITIKKTDASTNPVNILISGGGAIEGVTTNILYQRYDSITLFYDTAAIRVIGTNKILGTFYGGIKSSAYTTINKDEFIECSATSGSFAITLQKASTVPQGTIKYIRKTDSTTNAITFVVDAADTTNAVSLTRQYDYVILMRGGTTQWRVVASSNETVIQGIRAVTANTTMTLTDFGLIVNNTANVVITLPAANTVINRSFWIKKGTNNAFSVTVTGSEQGTNTILSTQNDSILIQSDGTNYYTIARKIAIVASNTEIFAPEITTDQSDADLNILYPGAVLGYTVYCKNIVGGGMAFKKDSTVLNTWIRIPFIV